MALFINESIVPCAFLFKLLFASSNYFDKKVKIFLHDSSIQKKLRDQRAGRTGLLLKDEVPGQTELFDDIEEKNE